MPEHALAVRKIVVVRIVASSVLFEFQVTAHQICVKGPTNHKIKTVTRTGRSKTSSKLLHMYPVIISVPDFISPRRSSILTGDWQWHNILRFTGHLMLCLFSYELKAK